MGSAVSPYRLVSLNQSRTVLHLCIEGVAERHIGHQFFQPKQ